MAFSSYRYQLSTKRPTTSKFGNTSNQALLTWFVPLWPEITRRIELGDRLKPTKQLSS